MNRRSFVPVVAAALLAYGATACADDSPGVPGAAHAAAGSEANAAPQADLQPGATVEFVASEFMFSPSELTAEPGTYTGVFVNDGTVEHRQIEHTESSCHSGRPPDPGSCRCFPSQWRRGSRRVQSRDRACGASPGRDVTGTQCMTGCSGASQPVRGS